MAQLQFIVMDMTAGLPLVVADDLKTALACMTTFARRDIEKVVRDGCDVSTIRRLSVIPETDRLGLFNRMRSQANPAIMERISGILDDAETGTGKGADTGSTGT